MCGLVFSSGTRLLARATLLLGLRWTLAGLLPTAAQKWNCGHCDVGPGFEEVLEPQRPLEEGSYASTVHAAFITHIERISITSDIGGWEPPSFNRNLASEIIKGWRGFQRQAGEDLPDDHPVKNRLQSDHAGALNDAFFQYQKEFFEKGGVMEAGNSQAAEDLQENTTWPELNALPEYRRLRRIVEKLSRRYLRRSGMKPDSIKNLSYSIFNWAAVHSSGEFHGPHTHVGEYHVGVFYAQVGDGAGKIRFGDPRGQNPPFARSMIHSPKAGELVLFPSWLSHMATVSHPRASIPQEGDEPLRVAISFNIGPREGPLPCSQFFSDPTANMRFQRSSPIDLEEWGL